jgi:hypothetical protein
VAAAVGLGLNVSFLWSFGRTFQAGVIFASIGLVIDGATLILPSVVGGLFARRCYLLGMLAAALYAMAATMTILASIGFAATNIGDTVSGRTAALFERTGSEEALARLKAERNRLPPFAPTSEQGVAAVQAAIALAILSRDQACGRAGRTCRRRETELTERQSELMKARKDMALTAQAAALDAKLGEAEGALKAVPPLAVADPQIEGAIDVIAWISRGVVVPAPADLKMFRILGLAAPLVLAGLFFPFAAALRQS